MTFNELQQKVLKAKKDNTPLPEGLTDQEKHQLDCLLHPDSHPLVWKLEDCDCKEGSCVSACTFQALEIKDSLAVFDLEGNFEEALPIHFRFTELFNLMFIDGNPAGVKCALNALGIIENILRLPLVPTRLSTNEKIHRLLRQLHV